jgi:hypothetical protein
VRLEILGLDDVYDYAGGKADWRAAGLPIEGTSAAFPTAGTLVATAPACDADASSAEAEATLDEDVPSLGICIVTAGEDAVVVGVYEGKKGMALDVPVTQEIKEAPRTVRASAHPDDMLEKMTKHDLTSLLVTDPEGRLLGVVDRARVEAGAEAIASWKEQQAS